ncbi:MAG: hypothetical protein IJ055_08530 [Oscillospiraceae bacterium]|nr:hypothetical protein [Oscillospiraceae bacterium]
MNRFALAACAAVLLLTPMLHACGKAGTDSSVQTEAVYQSLPLPDLYLSIPENFQTTSSEAYDVFYQDEDATVIVTQDNRKPEYTSLHDYAISALLEYQNATTTLEVIEENTVYAGATAVETMEFRYTVDMGGDTLSKTCMAGYLTDGTTMYIITCKSDPETYERFRPQFLSILQSADFVK